MLPWRLLWPFRPQRHSKLTSGKGLNLLCTNIRMSGSGGWTSLTHTQSRLSRRRSFLRSRKIPSPTRAALVAAQAHQAQTKRAEARVVDIKRDVDVARVLARAGDEEVAVDQARATRAVSREVAHLASHLEASHREASHLGASQVLEASLAPSPTSGLSSVSHHLSLSPTSGLTSASHHQSRSLSLSHMSGLISASHRQSQSPGHTSILTVSHRLSRSPSPTSGPTCQSHPHHPRQSPARKTPGPNCPNGIQLTASVPGE